MRVCEMIDFDRGLGGTLLTAIAVFVFYGSLALQRKVRRLINVDGANSHGSAC